MVIGIWRDRTAKKVAAKHNLALDSSSYQAPTSYALMSKGSKRSTHRKMTNTAGNASIFDFDCVVTVSNPGDDDDSMKVEYFTCTLVDLPFMAPHTVLRRESFGSRFVAWAGGPGDTQIGNDDFDKRFKMQTLDAEFTRALLDLNVVNWMLRGDDVGKSMMFEFLGNKLLCMSKKRSVGDFPAMLDWAARLLEVAPPALANRYPLPNET